MESAWADGTAERYRDLPGPLLAWYRANARDLPWRRDRDPYRIWVSEIMLQQTRAAAVTERYERFLEAFPDVGSLAAAPEDRVLSLWQGLGYYRRARALHAAAKEIAARGRFPDTYEELTALPGIGDYTAGAILSAAFARPVPAVDGNVLRVAARLGDLHEDPRSPAVLRRIRDAVASLYPAAEEDIRIFGQALMELGATVCVPDGTPRCGECPVSAWCLGRERGTAASLPVRTPKKARRKEDLTVFVFLREGRTALRERPAEGLLAGLWEFPNVPGILDEAGAAETVTSWGLAPSGWLGRMEASHVFTHVEWRMRIYVLTVSGAGDGLFWADRTELAEKAVPSAFARARSEAAVRMDGEAAHMDGEAAT